MSRYVWVAVLAAACNSGGSVRGRVSYNTASGETGLEGVTVRLVALNDSLAEAVAAFCSATRSEVDRLNERIPSVSNTVQLALERLPNPNSVSQDSARALGELAQTIRRQGRDELATATGRRLQLARDVPDSVGALLAGAAVDEDVTGSQGEFALTGTADDHYVWVDFLDSADRRLIWWVEARRTVSLTAENESGERNYCGLDYEHAGTLGGVIQVTNVYDVPDVLNLTP